jgi:HAD superfamily hydrolase (TIGR01509 family)
MLQALIFDVDGTLADTERWGHRVAFNRAFAEAGLNWHWDEEIYGRLLAVTGGRERMRYFLELCRPDVPAGDLDGLIEDLQGLKTRHYHELVEQGGIPARPGILRLLQEGQAEGLRLAIATTTTPANVEVLLKHSFAADALDWFEVIGAGDAVSRKKPAPDIYLHVLRALGLPPEACLALEDSEVGLAAASAAGIPTVISYNDYTAEQDFSGALLVCDRLSEPGEPPRRLQSISPRQNPSPVDLATLCALHALWMTNTRTTVTV